MIEDCVTAVYNNKAIFSDIGAIESDPIELVQDWNSMRTEIINIASNCDINVQNIAWLEDSQFTFSQTEIQEAGCATSVTAVIGDCVSIAGIEDDPETGIKALFSLIGDAKSAYTNCAPLA